MEGINSGTILNQRYEIIECIGIGGMAEVFKAEDLDTGAIVALKILKREHSMETEFIKRFNSEAQSSSQLEHQNIVATYGIGQEGDIHYIIMEYIEGVTLKDYIDAYQSMSWQDSLKTAAQVLLAMDHAHSKHIIHRDIKPLNIMMGNDGSVKLADFGIARALNSGTIHAGDSAGSVHYFSPEQARGGYVDERSDIYSLGITLFEMLVGVVPFDGESNVSVALKHIDGNFVPPHDIDPEIPIGVSDLVVIATRKDPGMRFQSARDMIAKIRKVIENPHEGLIETMTEDPAAVVAAVLSEADGEKRAENEALKASLGVKTEEKNENDDEAFDDDIEDSDDETKGQKIRRRVALVLTYIVAAMFAFLAIVWVFSNVSESQKKIDSMFKIKYNIEDYIGHDSAPVTSALEESGLVVAIKEEISEKYPVGYILKQSPSADEDVYAGGTVTLTVAIKEDSIGIDDYVKQNGETVRQLLTDKGANVIVKEVASRSVEEHLVIRTVPKSGSYIDPGDDVILYVSSGIVYQQVEVPNIVGLSCNEAIEKIQNSNLNFGTIFPNAGEDITDLVVSIQNTKDEMNGVNSQPTPTVEPTEIPTETPTDEYPGYTDSVETEDIYGETAENEIFETDEFTSATPTEDGFLTDEPYSTENPEETPSSTPEPSPDIPVEQEKVLALDTVVSQYPPAGTMVYEWETVDIFFYSLSELMYLEETETVTISYPADVVNSGDVKFIKAKFTLETGEIIDKVSFSNVSYEDFPLEIKVPFAYGSDVTMVDIYINDTRNIYKKIYVYND